MLHLDTANEKQPGHEYTKGNVKFCMAVSESEPIKKLQTFAAQNQQTQGKFTIGDEKLHNVFMRVNVGLSWLVCEREN